MPRPTVGQLTTDIYNARDGGGQCVSQICLIVYCFDHEIFLGWSKFGVPFVV